MPSILTRQTGPPEALGIFITRGKDNHLKWLVGVPWQSSSMHSLIANNFWLLGQTNDYSCIVKVDRKLDYIQGGHQGVHQSEVADELRKNYYEGGFSYWSLRGTGLQKTPTNLLLRAQTSKFIPSLFKLDINASKACCSYEKFWLKKLSLM